MIHPTAIIHPKAQLDSSVRVGPYAVIDEHVTLGADCCIGPHVYITGQTRIGPDNHFHAGCVIGDAPQDLKYRNEPTRLVMGSNNVFREHTTVHRSNKVDEDTTIGSNCFLMANCHVGHNSHLGSSIVIANGALIAGHVEIGDRAFISGNCLIHQFARVGTLALMQGGAAISKDLPPFTIARGDNGICGLNIIGLRRAGVGAADRLELKQLYHLLFRNQGKLSSAITEARLKFTSATSRLVIDFVCDAKRGVCADTGLASDKE